MVQIVPYLNFDGQCEEAFRFYERCFGGVIDMLQDHGDSPMADQTPIEWHDRILHARLRVGDWVLMGSDSPPSYHVKAQGFAVAVNVEDPREAERIFAALAEDGQVQMPIQQTFWALRFGMATDRFGTPWMINCDLPPG